MKQLVLELLILLTIGLIIMAVVFRDRRARDMLRTLRNAAWLYITLLLLFVAYEIVRKLL